MQCAELHAEMPDELAAKFNVWVASNPHVKIEFVKHHFYFPHVGPSDNSILYLLVFYSVR